MSEITTTYDLILVGCINVNNAVIVVFNMVTL